MADERKTTLSDDEILTTPLSGARARVSMSDADTDDADADADADTDDPS